jgi:hypothetical protein
MQPSVLVICERAAERETIRVLVGTMGCQWVLTSTIEEALAMLSRERASAALLELPGAVSDPDRMHQKVREVLVRLPGRVIALTDGMPAPPVSELISECSIPWVRRDRLVTDLWPRLESMVYPQLGMRRLTRIARLVLDTFLQPLPAGIRCLQPDTRQLVYEAESVTVDLAFECPPDSTRTTLVGQLMRTNEPQILMNSVPVVLKSRKGPLGVSTTNEVGEFTFEFQNEPSVSLEIEASPNDWVLIISPRLEWMVRAEDPLINQANTADTFAMVGTPCKGKRKD